MVRPPKPGSPSYDLRKEETDAIRAFSATRIALVVDRLDRLEDISCSMPHAGHHVFRHLRVPMAANKYGERYNLRPDQQYPQALFEKAGIQAFVRETHEREDGRIYLKLACPSLNIDEYMQRLETLHSDFMQRYVNHGSQAFVVSQGRTRNVSIE